MEVIKSILISVSDDKRILVIILAWEFGGFLEVVVGLGTVVAIPVGIKNLIKPRKYFIENKENLMDKSLENME